MKKEILRYQRLAGIITESQYSSKLEELGGGMSPKRVFKRAVVAKLNKIYNSVDNEELKQKLMDTINPTIDSIVNGKYGDDIGKYPMADLLDDLDDYLKSITQSIINQSSPKDSLNENFVGMGMVGNIFDREKTDYELAFEHFTKGTSLNEEMDSMDFDMKKEELLEKIKNLKDFGLTGDEIEFNGLLITCSKQEDNVGYLGLDYLEGTPHYFVYEKEDESEDGVFNSTNPEEIVEFVLNY